MKFIDIFKVFLPTIVFVILRLIGIIDWSWGWFGVLVVLDILCVFKNYYVKKFRKEV